MADSNSDISDSTPAETPMDCPTSRETWEQLPEDPNLEEDLGYELLDLDVYDTGGDRVILLPKDEDMLWEEAFIVAMESDIHSFDASATYR